MGKIKKQVESCFSSNSQFEVPVLSPEGVCYQFICANDRYHAWVRVMKLRYWLDFGSRNSSGYFVNCRDTKNNRGEVTHHLIQVFASQDDNDKVQLFTLNLYNLKKNIMIQGSHKELWKDREFNILKTLVDDCIHNKHLSESYFIVTGVRINIECSDELDPSDNEKEFPGEEAGEEAQGEESHDKPINVVSDSDYDEVDIKPKNQCIKSRTPLRKRKGRITPRRNKLKKAIQEKKTAERKQKPTVIKKESEMVRLRNLEEVTCRIDSVIASQLSNSIVVHEDTIEEIVKFKTDQQLKDLKEQQKNSLAVLRDKICNLENHFESEISSLKSEIEKIRSKNTNVNERCGKMEKCVKENRILLEKVEDNMKVRLYELKDELDSTHASNIKIDAGTETESNELVQENKLNDSTEHKSDPADIPSSVHQSIERFRSKRNSADIVVLMDSNRHYMDFSYLFPEKQVRVISCGSVERARTIINNPRFFDVEAIIIHTGTNNLEDNSLSSRHIANTLIEISETALNMFPNSEIFLSEITPRRDQFHLKGMEVNSMIKGAIESYNFQLVCHSNLSKKNLYSLTRNIWINSVMFEWWPTTLGSVLQNHSQIGWSKKPQLFNNAISLLLENHLIHRSKFPLKFKKVFNLEIDKLCLHHNQCINSHCLMLELCFHKKSHKTQCRLYHLLIKMLCQKCWDN